MQKENTANKGGNLDQDCTNENIKLWQSICSHKGALLTNTGTSGSKCALCGKEMTPPNPNMNV